MAPLVSSPKRMVRKDSMPDDERFPLKLTPVARSVTIGSEDAEVGAEEEGEREEVSFRKEHGGDFGKGFGGGFRQSTKDCVEVEGEAAGRSTQF